MIELRFVFVDSAGVCPDSDWHYYNSYCYYPSEINGTIANAWMYCFGIGDGTRLVSFSDQQELDFVISIS